MISPVRQSMKARAAVRKILLHMYLMMFLLNGQVLVF
jgi:hypothetical protein